MHSGKARSEMHVFLFSYQNLVCKNNCDCPTGLFKGNPAEPFRSSWGLGVTPACLQRARCWPSGPPCMSEGVNCSVTCQTHPSRSGQLRSRPCFHFVFRRPDKGSRMLFCLHLATCAPSLKVESPLPDQRAVKWSWKTAPSTSSPQLSLSLQSAARCQIYSLLCEHGHKNQQKQPHAMVISLSRPSATLMRSILRVSAVKGLSMSSQDTSDPICLYFFLLKQFSVPSI